MTTERQSIVEGGLPPEGTKKRIFAHIGSRAAARTALNAPAGWLVNTRLMLPVGESIELCLRLGDEGRSCLVPVTVVGRRPGHGILVRASHDISSLGDDDEPRAVTITFRSYADLQDSLLRMLCSEPILWKGETQAPSRVFVRLRVGTEQTARIAFAARLLSADRPGRVRVLIEEPASRSAVESFLRLRVAVA